jgi:hypothetical protein
MLYVSIANNYADIAVHRPLVRRWFSQEKINTKKIHNRSRHSLSSMVFLFRWAIYTRTHMRALKKIYIKDAEDRFECNATKETYKEKSAEFIGARLRSIQSDGQTYMYVYT